MGYTIDAKPDGEALRVTVSGAMDGPPLAHDADEAEGIALACISSGCRGVLLDVRKVSFDADVRERLRALSILVTAVPSDVRFAAVGVPAELREDEHSEPVGGIHGPRYRIFDDEAEALAWLAEG
ncbi:MAG: hypothetical protein ACYTKD_29050 [Planctomycetota bacterium]|jgi:hypothetical protein